MEKLEKKIMIRLTKEEYYKIIEISREKNISFSRCIVLNAIENIEKNK